MRIVSISSHVAYGHVGNSAAVFPLQRLGHEVYPVHTVTFASHTGYGPPRGLVLSPEVISDVLTGLEERGVFPRVDAVLSGYVGDAEVGAVVLDAVARVRAANPVAVYCCDPAMGDVGRGFFVKPGIPEYLRDRVVTAADIVTPNQFELEFLTGRTIGSTTDLLAAAAELRARGPEVVLVTSVLVESTPAGSVQTACVTGDGAWLATTPLLPLAAHGSGDLAAALFLAHHLTDGPRVALARTTGTLYAVLEATHRAGSAEMLLVETQSAIAHPDADVEVADLG